VNALLRKIHMLIQAQGPLTIAQYMAMALGDPEHGYYMRGDPLGRDFITAPEVSQIFGELTGLFFVQAWEDRGAPQVFDLVELGPGRGTLMADMIRAAAKVRPRFVESARIVLVESSRALRQVQAHTLAPLSPIWVSHFAEVPAGRPLFLVANEFFDALPIRQFVKSERGWHERMVTSHGEDLRFVLAPDAAPQELVPAQLREAPLGSVYELSSAARGVIREIADRIVEAGGLALILDYGHRQTAVGDTFQAVKDNAFVDPLAEPGESDLTAHVDFEALAAAVKQAGLRLQGPVGQRDFLEALGIRPRADRLKLDNPKHAADVDAALHRLISPVGMGTLFKAMAITRRGDPPAPAISPVMTQLLLETRRLRLVAANAWLIRMELADRAALSAALRCAMPPDWPPPLNDEASFGYFLGEMERNPSFIGWGYWYIVESASNEAIGICGFKGRPDESGQVEIGYSIVPARQRSGFASEAVAALSGWCKERGARSIVGETFPDLVGSVRVMEKNGFFFVGEGSEPGTVRYRCSLVQRT
jgi:NADH dehydrogenase [ubiquinone] 1 alpha subcomplex assembly factor 7